MKGSTPDDRDGIESILTEEGDRDAERRFDKTYNRNEQHTTRHPRTSTFNIKTDNEKSRLGDLTLKDLSQLIQSLMSANQNTSAQNQSHNYTIAPRPRYHLVDLKSFSGKSEDYPVWRQNLEICLERETFKDEKDKALFVLNHRSGTPYDHCKYYIRPLTENPSKT